MAAKILDGSALAQKIKRGIKEKVSKLEKKPGLGVVLVGDDPASQAYVRGKEKDCSEVGIISKKIVLDRNAAETDVMKVVDELNQDNDIDGFIVQLPLPEHISGHLVIDAILPNKDADGFSPINLGNMLIGNNIILPATPKGIIRLLEEYNIELEGKHAVVIGRSNIVGKPISLLLQQKNATVTMCHSRTKKLKKICREADIMIAAAGRAKMITRDMVKHDAVVVDVGMNRDENGKLCGDVDFGKVKNKASYITPVPGGVGPLTRAMLLENTLSCYSLRKA
ncbi:bifunctional methylenetetrahydrofolate dehydrogenase/methenyltetrahydrofolate cyclohydrolase FolD [Candidatus Woesearchaeota archaeon]|nr:bifunctional methylenetetrahydrofolate dehydrogenase/methenyltetrahydrofolate cyclohydrolase FolD [Candidatus Woesearchaeota archaeon]